MPATDHHQKKIKASVRHVHLGDPRVRQDAASSTHSTGRPGVRLTPASKLQGDPSIEFQPPSDEGKDMKDRAEFPLAAVLSVEGGSSFFSFSEQELSPLQVIQILLDREEDAKHVCRLDQPANRADGLCARVLMDDVFSLFFV